MEHVVVLGGLLGVEGEYLFEVLLEGDDEGEDSVILQRRPEVSGFFDEDLIEVAVIILDLVHEVPGKVLAEGPLGAFLQHFQLVLESVLALLDDLVKVRQFFLDVLLIYPIDLLLEVVYLLFYLLLDLVQA
jgi:hypothetical protein